MCSIGGWYSKTPLSAIDAERLATALLYYGSDRGKQSGGIWSNDMIVKAACEPLKLTALPDFAKAFENGSSLCLTHTRQPTSGGRGDNQAQPFSRPNTVTTHNGMFHNVKGVREKYQLSKPTGVDSELATDFIETYGVRGLPEFLDHAFGSAALAIYRKHPLSGKPRVYLIRHNNPLETLTLNLPGGNKITAWGSTEQILLSAMRYVWLVPPMRTKTLAENVLHVIKPTGVRPTNVRVPDWQARFRGDDDYIGESYGRGVSSWTPKPKTDSEKVERLALLQALGWQDTGGFISLETLRRAARNRGIGRKAKKRLVLRYAKPDDKRSEALDRYFKDMREARTPSKADEEAYRAWLEDCKGD